jgi:alkylglycerol monooxygenase
MVALIIPAFFLFLALEYAAAVVKKKQHLFNYSNSVANLSIGIAERLLSLFITSSFYTLYYFIYRSWALFHIPNHWLVWLILLMATDFVWYWYHRLGHEINIFWGAHIVHHHSEDFNYTVSARITTLQAIVRNLFWCILPLIGFHPAMVITILIAHGAYSFFTHTQLIGKLGWLEYIFITPTHHGVHHASNPKYINKNYGDIFIFWDKVFGTFQEEEEKPVYGLTHPLTSKNFLWQHFHYYAEMWEACRRSGKFRDSVRIILGKPEDLDQSIRPLLERKLLIKKISPDPAVRSRLGLNTMIILSLVGLAILTIYMNELHIALIVAIVVLIIATLIYCGTLLDLKSRE